ncbi:MAG: peptidoglycan DD-metalloendopeptidase family protein [Bacteroidota bacterium]
MKTLYLLLITICAAGVFNGLHATKSPELFNNPHFCNADSAPVITYNLVALDKIIADSISKRLRINNDIFRENWFYNTLFVYDNFSPELLPDTIRISLLEPDQSFVFPRNGKLYWGYGSRGGRMHHGLDIKLVTGDKVVCAFDGIVRYAKFNYNGYGYCVVVRHLNGLETYYGHLSKISVAPDQFVRAGDLLGLGGSTGRSSGPHLHFETRYKDYSFDPFLFIDAEARALICDTLVLTKKELIQKHYPADFSFGPEYAPRRSIKKQKLVAKKRKKNAVRYHVVRRGESFYSIAKKYKISIASIYKLNSSSRRKYIKPGQKIRVK